MAKVLATPGVYIEEKSAFPNSAVPVATAVPAFVGYTEKALRDTKDLSNVPTRISSLAEFQLYFGQGPKTTYDLTILDEAIKKYRLSQKDGRYLLYLSMKFFFANGGSDCYIVSIGNYAQPVKKEDFLGKENIGIDTLKKESEPTMLVIPDSMLLGQDAYGELHQAMLAHCSKMTSRFAILDVYMDENAEAEPDTQKIAEAFRNNIGDHNLQWGAAYYPWLETTIDGSESVSFTNLAPKAIDPLIKLLEKEVDDNRTAGHIDDKRAEKIKAEIQKLGTLAADTNLHQTLLVVSPLYKTIMETIMAKINLLPPSGGLAGIYSMIDNNVGVFQSPANVSIGSVIKPCVNITDDVQEDLNTPLNGKAINAIRTFPGKGVLIWGARTLDGNSQDWRYVSVRRTVIFIEQSIKYAVEPYVFAPNTAATWTNVKVMISNFLTNVWQSGALAGAMPDQAFSVDVGLGTTMTPVDVLDGIMRITVKIAVTRPAEFIVITLQQKMQES
ncbi:phage tail sheath family protein [Haliscomenobacter hydrossis]|uniref:Tail sheath protein C-terminal domain-containing protein n=1 Tax=Haliscomenobacter hydrossis (strain ATCC 27775 / DSM 1100 / LMG 10767 / O) TaxID=760192 RepID=F4KPV9_HALH1|nr:phage tail sheath C-terminal domain-containing protein [Haliscomenobacter hydrossis]AEE52209.1 hypothetical protein Halhy_4365 [Haliscomenobacter hydrossis DSM 1100]